MKFSKSSLLYFISAASSLATGMAQIMPKSNIKDVVGDGGANSFKISVSYTNDDGAACEPCTFCKGSSTTDFFHPESPSVCITCGTGEKKCNQMAVTTSFKKPWTMEYTTFTSHDGEEVLHDPETMTVQASKDYDAASKKGTWKTLRTSSSALVFQERYLPQDVILDNDDEYGHYRIVLKMKDGSSTMKVGHYGLVQAYLKPYTAKLYETITGQKVKGLPTQEVTWARGEAGATCDDTCKPLGLSCSSYEQTQINTYAKVVEAFKQAGYACKGQGVARAYAGSPNTRDDGRCSYFGRSWHHSEHDKSSCNANLYDVHYPLCACV